jgi:diaminopimelate epimerase
MHFYKAHGLGNDYIAVDGTGAGSWAPPAVRAVCDRHRGVGSDGLLVRVESDAADFGVRIFNPDGGEAEKSGNGLRIFGAYLLSEGRVAVGRRFTVETRGGVVSMEVLSASADGVCEVEVEMGTARFSSTAAGLRGPERETVHEPLLLESGGAVDATVLSIGNPHCVVFVDELALDDLRRRGPQLSTHAIFEFGTNVQLARVAGPGALEALVWERGAGETQASGSSACAVAAAAVRRGLTAERRLEVRMPGGSMEVEVRDDWSIRLRGPVEDVCTGRLSDGMVARLGAG